MATREDEGRGQVIVIVIVPLPKKAEREAKRAEREAKKAEREAEAATQGRPGTAETPRTTGWRPAPLAAFKGPWTTTLGEREK